MRYDIRLSMSYQYGAPSDHARTVVRLLPSDIPGRQLVTARRLSIEPRPAARRDTTDFFGNAMSVLAFQEPIDRIEFTLEARAERMPASEGLDLSPRIGELGAEVLGHRSLGPASPHHFIGPSTRVGPDPAVADFAMSLADPMLTVRQTAERVARAVHDEMRFDPTATTVDTPLAEAFASRHGVCQDFSHVTIAALRSLGIPAGYVSGYLRTTPPEGQPRLEGADAMHAWVSVWCGSEAGWLEVDPTNACVVGTDHVSVAYGRDYADIAPVKGVLRTSGVQTSQHSVDVIPI